MKSSIGRRDFNKLAVAALGGLVAGASVAEAADKKDTTKPLMLQEPHVCRGLNPNCKGEVKGKKHDCAGQTNCASANRTHLRRGQRLCRPRRLRRNTGRKHVQGQGRLRRAVRPRRRLG